uniref:N-acetylated alpha-linked acidic dipeptidase like 2 n=1 Tax=Oryzias latipes TaxID=8090 RepID=A0A3P9IFF5_ORYLA
IQHMECDRHLHVSPGLSMAYSKVCDVQGGALDSEALHCPEALDPAWNLDKDGMQDPGPSMDHMQMQHVEFLDRGPDPEVMESVQPSVSPHGRFERLQEDPNYNSRFTRALYHKEPRQLQCFTFRYFVTCSGLLKELLEGIKADKINSLQSLSDEGEEARARYLYRQWVEFGLTNVQVSEHTVLVSKPGSTPNTITDRSSHQCFLPTGISCDQREPKDGLQQQFSYAAYSATGSLVDVQYGSVDDLRRAKDTLNLTNQIAVVKLGKAPLLYKLALLSQWGFAGALLYVDPCDAPFSRSILHQIFRVTLNPGGTNDPFFSLFVFLFFPDEAGGNLTSLLVQPISAFLAKALLSCVSMENGKQCVPLAMPPNAEPLCSLFSDRYVLVGSRHDMQGGGSSAIVNQLIAALTEQTKKGWDPDRTTVFCSWGGSAMGNIGSYEWGKDNSVVLQSSAVAYISLNTPVRGTETLRASASPTLLQQLLSCIRGGNCPGPNVSSLQLPGDMSFFANQLAVPTLEFAFEQTTTSFLSEGQFPVDSPETLDPLFKFHETITKMTAEALLRLVNDPVLPFYPLDVTLDVQNKLKAVIQPNTTSRSSALRDHAAFFQSEMMRPANDPKERDPSHMRMLNDKKTYHLHLKDDTWAFVYLSNIHMWSYHPLTVEKVLSELLHPLNHLQMDTPCCFTSLKTN